MIVSCGSPAASRLCRGASLGAAGMVSGGIDDRLIGKLRVETGRDRALERVPDAVALGRAPGRPGIEIPALGEHGFLEDAWRELHRLDGDLVGAIRIGTQI